jgi:hypothetical protein
MTTATATAISTPPTGTTAKTKLETEVYMDQKLLIKPKNCDAAFKWELVIHGVKPSVNGSLPSYALWRCGPVITAQGRQDSSQPIQLAMMVDGLDGDSAGQAFQASTSDSKSFTFNLALKGLSTRSIPARVKAVCAGAVCAGAACVGAVCTTGPWDQAPAQS